MSRIIPFLWYDTQAEEAADFYVSIFSSVPGHSGKRLDVSHYNQEGSDVSGQKKGSVMVAEFELDGQTFSSLNGGPYFKFTGAISFMVPCKTQEEVDLFWSKFSEGGEEQQCGWVKDKYGVHWQIVPELLGTLMSDPDTEKSERVMHAMLQMKKIDIAGLQKAYNNT